jgi:hypothetical protein
MTDAKIYQASMPLLHVCMGTLYLAWVLPCLAQTSKAFGDIIRNEKIASYLPLIFRVRAVANVFKSACEARRLKNLVVQHIWILWTKANSSNATLSIGRILKELSATTIKNKISLQQAKDVGFARNRWTALLKTAISLACWMNHFGMERSVVYTIFVHRMDALLSVMKKEKYPFSLKKGNMFSGAINSLVGNSSHKINLVVWNTQSSPLGFPEVSEMLQIWERGASPKTCLAFINSLNTSVRNCLLAMICFEDLRKGNQYILGEKKFIQSITALVCLGCEVFDIE